MSHIYTRRHTCNIDSAYERKIQVIKCGLFWSAWRSPVASIFMQRTWLHFYGWVKLYCVSVLSFPYALFLDEHREQLHILAVAYGLAGSIHMQVALWHADRLLYVYTQQRYSWVIGYQVMRNLHSYFIVSVTVSSVWGFLFLTSSPAFFVLCFLHSHVGKMDIIM